MNAPLVSVIIATYNRAELVVSAVSSALAQTHDHLEVVLVDDGSSDDTQTRLKAIDDPRLRLFFLGHSGHLAALRQFGLDRAKGEFLAFLDSDDRWDSNYLQCQLERLLAEPDAAFAFANVRLVRAKEVLKPCLYCGKLIDTFKGLVSGQLIIYPSATVIRTSALAISGGYDTKMRAGDHHLLTRLAARFQTCPEQRVLVSIGRGGDQLSDMIPIANLEEMVTTIDHCREQGWLTGRRARFLAAKFHYQLGCLYQERGRYSAAVRVFQQALRGHPYRPGFWLRWFTARLQAHRKKPRNSA